MAKIVHVGTDVQMHLSVLTDDDNQSVLPARVYSFVLHKLADESFEELKGLMRRQFAAVLAELAAQEAAVQGSVPALPEGMPPAENALSAAEELTVTPAVPVSGTDDTPDLVVCR